MSIPRPKYKAYDGEVFLDRDVYLVYESSLLKPCKLCGGAAKWTYTPVPLGNMVGQYKTFSGWGRISCRDCGISFECTLNEQPMPKGVDKYTKYTKATAEVRLKAALEEVRRRWQVLMGK